MEGKERDPVERMTMADVMRCATEGEGDTRRLAGHLLELVATSQRMEEALDTTASLLHALLVQACIVSGGQVRSGDNRTKAAGLRLMARAGRFIIEEDLPSGVSGVWATQPEEAVH